MGGARADAAQLSGSRTWPLVVRRARPADEQAIVAFATRTWHDWDYIPHAWPRWLEERDGVMLVGVVGQAPVEAALDAEGNELDVGLPVAVVRVAMPAPGEAWLEGIRVDPRVRGMDVATDLQVAELAWAAEQGAVIVRYATGAQNEGSHRLGARGGFELVAAMRSTWWSATGNPDDDDDPSGFLPEVQADVNRRRRELLAAARSAGLVLDPAAVPDVWPRLEHDATFRAAASLYEPRPWALDELTAGKFAAHAAAGEVLALPDGRFALAVFVAEQGPAEDSALRLATLGGDPDAAFDLLEALRALAGEPLRFRYPVDAPIVTAVEERYRSAGYVFADWTLHVLARPLDAANPVPAVNPARVVLADRPQPLIVASRS
jgi:GNAT superfamily N-acetyltransferase